MSVFFPLLFFISFIQSCSIPRNLSQLDCFVFLLFYSEVRWDNMASLNQFVVCFYFVDKGDGYWVEETYGFIRVPNLKWKNYLHYTFFFSKKRKLCFKSLTWPFMFWFLHIDEKSILHLNLQTSEFPNLFLTSPAPIEKNSSLRPASTCKKNLNVSLKIAFRFRSHFWNLN